MLRGLMLRWPRSGPRSKLRGHLSMRVFWQTLILDEAGNDLLFAQKAARPQHRQSGERHTDEDDLQGGGARLIFGRDGASEQRSRQAPQSPDQDSAQESAAVIAGSANDQHGPDLEGHGRSIVLGRDEADEMRL